MPPQLQQQPQLGGGQSVNGGAMSEPSNPSGGSGGQEMNLASVLHYLQSEWRRWERDRNEWEIERAEMRARIALLEGQRRSAENLKVDLLRRVKMLEFALRQERTKTQSTTGKASGISPGRFLALQDEDKVSRDDKEGSGSEGSEEGERPKLNGSTPAAIPTSKSAISLSLKKTESNSWKNTGGVPRDPKARARSREYLKQCLQEITYLTSPGAMNPLPLRAPVNLEPSSPVENGQSADQEALQRPQKALPDQPIPYPYRSEPPEEAPSLLLPNGTAALTGEESSVPASPLLPESQSMYIDPTARPPSSPAPKPVGLPEENILSSIESPEKQALTAIYRPDSKAAWREELRAANEMAEKAQVERSRKASEADDELMNLPVPVDVEEQPFKSDEGLDKVWTSRKSLKSHLDVVRSVAFAHGPGILLATGSDDNTVKVWSVEAAAVMTQKPSSIELEPIMTLRGHTAPITSVLISTSLQTIFSSSLDSTVRLWKLPTSSHDPYSAFDPSFTVQTLVGHTDAIWDLCLLPPRSLVKPGKHESEGRLISVSSDSTVKVWEVKGGNHWALTNTFEFEIIPTVVTGCSGDFGKVFIGFMDGSTKLWDVDEGKEVMRFDREGKDDKDVDQRVNAILSHPTLPIFMTAHEDGNLIFYETTTTTPTHTILAHPSPITSLSISPMSSTTILTSSTDCTIRLWDITKKTSLQELSGHRKRADEGVLQIVNHPELPLLASAGADGIVRLWGAA
ncbi:striatin 1/3/4, partial [Tremellales sp. Uapishka_1]